MELEAAATDAKGGALRLLRRPGLVGALGARLLMGLVVFMFRHSLALLLTYRFNVPAEYLGLAFSYQVRGAVGRGSCGTSGLSDTGRCHPLHPLSRGLNTPAPFLSSECLVRPHPSFFPSRRRCCTAWRTARWCRCCGGARARRR